MLRLASAQSSKIEPSLKTTSGIEWETLALSNSEAPDLERSETPDLEISETPDLGKSQTPDLGKSETPDLRTHSVENHPQKLIGTQHLLVIIKAALKKLAKVPEDLGTFLSSCLASLSALLESSDVSMISGLEELGQFLSRELIQSQTHVPLLVFLIWKLKLLSLSALDLESNDLRVDRCLSLLLSQMEAVWSEDDERPLKKCRTEEPSMISRASARRETKTNLLMSLLLMLSNLTRTEGKKTSCDDFTLLTNSDIDLSQSNDIKPEDSFVRSTFEHRPEFLQFIEDNFSLAVSGLVIPMTGFVQHRSTVSDDDAANLNQERSHILNVMKTTDDKSDGFHIWTDGGDVRNNVNKNDEICEWVVSNITQLDVISITINFIISLNPSRKDILLAKIHNDILPQLRKDRTVEWTDEQNLEFQINKLKLHQILYPQKRFELPHDIRSILKNARERCSPIKLPHLLDIVERCSFVSTSQSSDHQVDPNDSNERKRIEPTDDVRRYHNKLHPICDLLYGACPKEQLTLFTQKMAEALIFSTAELPPGNVSENAKLNSLCLGVLECNRVMNSSFGYHLLPIERYGE